MKKNMFQVQKQKGFILSYFNANKYNIWHVEKVNLRYGRHFSTIIKHMKFVKNIT